MPKKGNQRGMVLVVDDEQLLVDFLRTGLEYEGFEVKTAIDGLSALVAARSLRPDVVILLSERRRSFGCRRVPSFSATLGRRRLRD